MEFETKTIPGHTDYVAEFIESLDEGSDEEDTVAYKILDKFSDWKDLSFLQLTCAKHIKQVENKLYEVRVKVKSVCYRFLGYTSHNIFYMVHAIKKKSNKLSKKDIKLAHKRIRIIKEHENHTT